MGEETIVVVGAGTAGNHIARTLGRAGRRVVLAEHDLAGGTCLWHGCVPKKALYAAGRTRRQILDASKMGLGEGERQGARIDWARTRAWQQEVMSAYAGDQAGILAGAGVELVRGTARFTSPDTVAIGDAEHRAAHVVVASGSQPILPDIPGADLMDTSDDALFYDELPASLAIVGGGYIAMEMAAIYAWFGVSVHLIVRGGAVLAKGFDPECADVALEGVCALGVDARLETQVREVRGEPGLLTVVVFDRGGREHGLQVERVLAATGRKAALEALDLETGGVAVGGDERPLVDSHLRSVSNPRVWVAGDASGGIQLTPVAGYQGSRVAESIMSGRPQVSDTSGIPSTCFTQPEIARVGELESELIARGAPYKVAHGAFSGTAQGIIDGGRRSLVKLLFDADDRLAGAHLAGPEAGEHIYGLSVALQADATLTDLQSARAIHPTLAEGIYWAASNAERVEGERTQG